MEQSLALEEVDRALQWPANLNELAKHTKFYGYMEDLKTSGISGVYHFLEAFSNSTLDVVTKREFMRHLENHIAQLAGNLAASDARKLDSSVQERLAFMKAADTRYKRCAYKFQKGKSKGANCRHLVLAATETFCKTHSSREN